ncbi:hypothetical protein [Luteolibacter sp. Populi]|uniref:hypothetical protein n=1 Tax=Luteolibacter sp. Populi TaxID=3230487 RepID=UPI00346735FC
MKVIYHRGIKRDLRSALTFYEQEGGGKLEDRFFAEAEETVASVLRNPQRYHYIARDLRRAALSSFPYHFVFEEDVRRIRFLVLRHDKQHPRFGLGRR